MVNAEECAIEVSPNVLHLEKYPIGEIFQEKFKLPAVLGNDVQLGLIAEHKLGAARGLQHVLGVFFGTGVGGAAIINGEIYQGANGFGGQVGCILAHHTGGPEALESHGMVDRVASKASIAGAALGLGAKLWAPEFYKEVGTDLSKVTWGAMSRARKAGDREIDDLLRTRLRVVGIALSNVVNFMNPQMLVLGGGLTEEMPRLVKTSIEKGLREYLTPEVNRALKVSVAARKNKAGAFGAAWMAFAKFSKTKEE
jgi:glucokinase